MCKTWVKEGVWEGKPTSSQGQLCMESWIHPELKGTGCCRGWRAEHRRRPLDELLGSLAASICPPCFFVFPREIATDLKTVTKRHPSEMRCVLRDFRGRQIGQNDGECRKVVVTLWFFLCDVWLYAVLWKRPVKGDVLTWIVRS